MLQQSIGYDVTWVPDTGTSRCEECENDFTVTRRRHHCRLCGHLMCGDCCKIRKVVGCSGYFETLRCCSRCANGTSREWIADDEYNNCGGCTRQFSWIWRKHHCRRCGKIFCSSCAKTPSSTTPRLCDGCHLEEVFSVWVPDSQSSVCMGCDRLFTIKNRRHHCRRCGQLFCHRCTHNHAYPSLRICKACRHSPFDPSPSAATNMLDVNDDDTYSILSLSSHPETPKQIDVVNRPLRSHTSPSYHSFGCLEDLVEELSSSAHAVCLNLEAG
eukprot:TRINITY_DN11885_c0_g2_i1.p1 TRINITY_DN11885_c0_g2~~TRINITY_DN11885_c0_g2_i1.p1  ORF type:complete len:281 (+),score=27.22 TRINITY_DN11885_c0_g2_i1:31-843(+)